MIVTQKNTVFTVELTGGILENEFKTLHGGLCAALRALHKYCQENEWTGLNITAFIFRLTTHENNDPYLNAEIVLIVEDLLPLGNGICCLRWDVPNGRCSRLKWFDDDSENGRIEAE